MRVKGPLLFPPIQLLIACDQQQTHFRSSLLSLRKIAIFRRERTDDRKCVCCSQAKLLNAFFFLPGVHLQIPERFCLKKLKRIRVLKLQKEQKENYSCYHGLFMRCFRFRSSPQPHARDSPIPRPVRLSRSPSHLVSGPGSSRSLRRSLCRRKHKKFLACPSPLGKI